MLAGSLIKRMRLDLTSSLEDDDIAADSEEDDNDLTQTNDTSTSRRWIAHPKSLRLSTRPRPPLNLDGTRSRKFNRISKSTNMPMFVFSCTHSVDELTDRLVDEVLMSLFRKLHPERSGWNLSLVNLCATNMSLTASEGKDGAGRDISMMFKRQEDVLKEWKVEDADIAPSDDEDNDHQQAVEEDADWSHDPEYLPPGSEDLRAFTQESFQGDDDAWDSDDNMLDAGDSCRICGAVMPPYAMLAHERFHDLPD